MSTITPYQPSLATALASLATQTQPSSGSASQSLPNLTTQDSLNLSQASTQNLAAALIEEQNQASALADPSEALTVNQSAAAFIAGQPGMALSAQSGADSTSVLNLIQGA